MGVITQTRYKQQYTAGMTDVQTTMDVDTVPANSVGYLTLRRGYADQEDIKYTGISGLQLTGLLRGLSPTALTDTEVLGLKKSHALSAVVAENTVEMTTLHYIINNKADLDDDEAITGNWSFIEQTELPGVKSTTGVTIATFTEEANPVNYFDIKSSATGSDLKVTALGTDTDIGIEFLGKGDGFVTLPDKSTLKSDAAPSSDAEIANKKYVDDQVAATVAPAEATTQQVGDSVEESGGSRLYINPKSVTKTHTIYTPAYLTGGASAETNISVWDSLTDGSFRVTIDGTAYNIDGINATSVAGGDMNDVAAIIQAAIRAATGSTETCVWSTDHFIITSVDTTVASEVSVLETSTGTVGTDISGAGASNWMDADTGNGVATAAVLDPTADAGKLIVLGATGVANEVLTLPSQAGKSGKYLKTNGSASAWEELPVDLQTFEANGTWTKPSGVNFVRVILYGGGGGGGGSGAATSAGCGGGGGARVERVFRASDLTATVSVTIGAGGNGGLASNYGTAGGATNFGTYAYAYGGGRGSAVYSGANSGGGGGGAGGVGGNGGIAASAGGQPAGTDGAVGLGEGGAGGPLSSRNNSESGGGSGGAGNGSNGGASVRGGGGGGGGGNSAAGGAGGSSGIFPIASTGGGGGAGGAATGGGLPGGNGTAGISGNVRHGGTGGGGGGYSSGGGSTGGGGGAGGSHGGGGGGGGTALSGTLAGGAGGAGYAYIYCW
jgi:hypothetical protein